LQEKGRPTSRRIEKRTPKDKPDEKKPSGKRNSIIAVAFIGIVAIAVVVGLYFTIWQDLWRTVVTVNDETVNMGYLIRRMKYVDKTDDILMMVYEIIPTEMLVRQGVSRYDIEVTTDELDELLRTIARGENETISEIEFNTWYRNALNESRLSDAEYREWIRTYAMEYRLHVYLGSNLPTVAEQIHLHVIVLDSYEDAEAVITRIQDGEEFPELARELSIDEESNEQGGDIGWWPEGGGLASNLEWTAFNLEIGEVNSVPILIDDDLNDDVDGIYIVCMVTERQLAREVEEDKLTVLRNGALEDWLIAERANSTIIYGGIDWNEQQQRHIFGSKTMAWISLQLAEE
jgi:foldase protein PrsA